MFGDDAFRKKLDEDKKAWYEKYRLQRRLSLLYPNIKKSKVYEQLVASFLSDETSYGRTGESIKPDVHILGRLSKVKRQIDVARYALKPDGSPEIELLEPIECRDKRRRLDVNEVGEFFGVMTDLRVRSGAMFSPAGFSRAARNFAEETNIKLVRLTWYDALTGAWHSANHLAQCRLCEDDWESGPPPWVMWSRRGLSSPQVGRCERCDCLHVGCQECGEVFGIHETEYNRAFWCPGTCGGVHVVEVQRVEKDHYSREIHYFDRFEVTVLRGLHRRARHPDEIVKLARRKRFSGFCPSPGEGFIDFLLELGLAERTEQGMITIGAEGARFFDSFGLGEEPEYPTLY